MKMDGGEAGGLARLLVDMSDPRPLQKKRGASIRRTGQGDEGAVGEGIE